MSGINSLRGVLRSRSGTSRKAGRAAAEIAAAAGEAPRPAREPGWTWLAWIGGGALMALPFLHDGLAWLGFVSLAPWLVALERSPRRAFLRGSVGGWVWLMLGLSWLNRVGWPGTVIVSAAFALYLGAFAWVVARLRHRGGIPTWVAAPLTFVTCEFLAEHVSVFNVTWLFLGHSSWRSTTLLQSAELGGISVLTALQVLAAGVLAAAFESVRRSGKRGLADRGVLAAAGTLVLVAAILAAYGAWRLSGIHLEKGPVVAAIQGDVPLGVRLDPRRNGELMQRHADLSRAAATRSPVLIAWSESAPGHFLESDASRLAALGGLAREMGTHLLVGAIGTNPDPLPPSNSAFLFAPDGGLVARSDKRVLVPGAETLLFLDRLPRIRQAISDHLSRTMGFRPYLEPGRRAVVMTAGDLVFGTLICYDDVVPMPARELRAAGAQALVVISNETWFGEKQMDQHVAMAAVRCVETRLPMIRATNDGWTCALDPAGRVTLSLDRHAPGVLVTPLSMTDARPVPPWVRLAWRLAIVAIVAGLVVRTMRPAKQLAP